MNRRVKGILNGAIASASYGTNPLFALPLFAAGIGINSVLFYRYALAVVIYGLWLKFVKKTALNISRKEFLPLLILGIFFSLSSLTLYDAFNYIEAGIACTILFIYPVLVAVIMALFFKEKITKTVISSILLTSVGIILLYKGKTGLSLNLYGVGIVFLSALLYALYIVGVKNIKAVKHINRAKMSFYVMLFGLLVYIINLKFCTQLQILDKPYLWLLAIGLSVFPTIISLETITISIKLVGSTTTAILGALEPLTALFFGVLIFHEQLTVRICMGVALILLGVLLIVTRKKKVK
ncbi:MAG TPA: DMT family transporter [Candidatus Stercorousia faecigallinarum]|nr:DMT family transporter [Candidatus Stercorousia faecigallinarum]